ncbi:MAG: MerR family transcriptional regulator [Magnetovibrio sp.]|nr:MerR family transcriptional regulator [Magnetovibrio sp.]
MAPQAKKSPGAFRTISEVSEQLDLPQHVLRFWETKFTQVRPMKRGGGRRYYRPEDVALLGHIKGLLYDEGYTIKGVQKLLRDGALKKSELEQPPVNAGAPNLELEAEVRDAIGELQALRADLTAAR